MIRFRRELAIAATALSLAAAASAAERIAAIVNKEVILESEVEEHVQQAAARLRVDPADSSALARIRMDVLEEMVERLVVLAEADKQGITVAPEEVEAAVDREIAALRERLGGQEAFQQALAEEETTEPALRARYQPEVRDQLRIARLVGKEVQSRTTVGDREVRAYFDANRDSIGKKPESLRLAHILIPFEPADSVVKKARTRADSLRTVIVKGTPFEEIAARFSADPSGRRGGDLGHFGRGAMVPEFEEPVFKLKVNEVSEPIRSRFGFHIVQVLEHDAPTDSTEERVRARHVLITIPVSSEDEERARRRAAAIRDSLRNGADFAEMARRHSADSATRDSAGQLGEVPVPSLPPNMREALAGLSVGEVSVPFRREAGYHLFKLLGRVPAADYDFDEIREDLRQIVMNRKLEESYRRWYERIKKNVTVELKN